MPQWLAQTSVVDGKRQCHKVAVASCCCWRSIRFLKRMACASQRTACLPNSAEPSSGKSGVGLIYTKQRRKPMCLWRTEQMMWNEWNNVQCVDLVRVKSNDVQDVGVCIIADGHVKKPPGQPTRISVALTLRFHIMCSPSRFHCTSSLQCIANPNANWLRSNGLKCYNYRSLLQVWSRF